MKNEIKKQKKSKKEKLKPISLYPLKPEEALSAFMKVDPKGYRDWLKVQKIGK